MANERRLGWLSNPRVGTWAKGVVALAFLIASPACAQTDRIDFYAATATADGECLLKNLPTLVATLECMRDTELKAWVRYPASDQQRAAYDTLQRDMIADAPRADAAGETFWVFAAKWASAWAAFYESLNLPTSTFTLPDWASKPKSADMQAYYPPALLKAKLTGSAILFCVVKADGTAADCKVVQESPVGYGVGAAALAMSSKFRMKPMVVNGVAVDGGPAGIPVVFDHSLLFRLFH